MPNSDPLALDRWPDRPCLADGSSLLSRAEVAARCGPPSEGHGLPIVVRAAASIPSLLEILGAWRHGMAALLVAAREPLPERELFDAMVAIELARIPGVALRTSGSSGRPKFALLPWESLVANALASDRRTPFGAGHRWLLSLSPHHVGGLSILVRAVVGGGCVRVGRGPGGVADDLLADPAITHLSVVATQLRRLLDDVRVAERMPRLAAILVGGGPTPRAWRDEALGRGWPLRSTYGLTECASQVATSPAEPGDAAEDAGQPLDGVEVRVADDGEILVRGATLFAGYLEARAVRDPRRQDGFFGTGDLGRLDERGRLRVLGRKDAMFISGGENIQPEEIEAVLGEVRGVSVACVVPVEELEWGRRPIAFVAGHFTAEDLEARLAAALPRFKWPDRILAMPEEEAARAKPRRGHLASLVGTANVLWTRPGRASTAKG